MSMKRFAPLVMVIALFALGRSAFAQGTLRVGAARVDQTGAFGPSQTGKYDHEHVYARAIVVDNRKARAAIISYEGDEDSGMDATRKGVANELKCPLENVIISHTHTHSRSVNPLLLQQGTNPSKTIVEAARLAMGKLEPAQVGFSTGSMSLNVNRDAIDPVTRKWGQGANLDAPSDKTVSVLTFEKPTGEPIAVYVNYAMHGIDAYVSQAVSGDFSGAMSRYVEKAFGDKIVVAFSQGTSGDQNPLYLRPSTNVMASRDGKPITGFQLDRETYEGPLRVADTSPSPAPAPDPKVLDDLFQFIQSQGQVLGEEVIRVMTFTKHTSSDVRIEGLEKGVSCPGRIRTNGDMMDPKTREGIEGVYKDGPPVNLRMDVLGIGTVALASINGEAFTLIGRRIKDEAPMKNTIIVTLANTRIHGYIYDDASSGHQSFQVLNSPFKPGCAERGITDAIVDLETQYMNGH